MLTSKQKEVILRLKLLAETDLEAANRALSENATEFDIRVALLLAHDLGIKL